MSTDPRAWRLGVPAVAVLLVGFTLGDAAGVPAWLVAMAVAIVLALAVRHVPWRSLPLEAAAVAAGLAVLTHAAQPHLGLHRVLDGGGPLADARRVLAGAVGAVTVNNLPALLVALPDLDDRTAWSYLAGVNIGPTLWISGSLAGLLWADIMRHHGHPVSPMEYARTGVRVGLPALAAALVVVAVSG